MKLFISQPMSNLTEEQVMEVRHSMEADLDIRGIEYPETTYYAKVPPDAKTSQIWLLANALEILAECDGIYMGPNWGSSRGCCLEYAVAESYGLPVYFTADFIPIPDKKTPSKEEIEYAKKNDVAALMKLKEATKDGL